MTTTAHQISEELLDYIAKSPSCYHAVENGSKMLEGFTRLYEDREWKLIPGGNYFVIRNDSSIIAFKIPENKYKSIRISAAHSDFPGFKVKTNPVMIVEKHYVKLNTEKYGGMIMSTWLDRPLSLAGRVVIKEDGNIVSKLINVDRDLLLIPSVAIHMNRDANDGFKYDAQVDTLPLFGEEADEEKAKEKFENIIASAAGVAKEDIIGSDIFLYMRDKGKIWGADNEYISSRALDDLQCAYGTIKGFILADTPQSALSLCCIFDNEEVGSLTGQGADSTFLADTLHRINESLGYSHSHLLQGLSAGYMISADNAHAVHPNHTEYADPTNRPLINKGIVIKFNAAQKYTTDGVSEAMFRDVCRRAYVPVQTYTNKSNMPGGSTLGNISNRHVSIRTVDIGLPQLAMHSAYETAGVKDTEYLVKAIREFFSGE